MAIEKFLEYLRRERHYSDKTIRSYAADLKGFNHYLSEVYGTDIDSAKTKLIRRWLVWLQSQGMKPRTINRKLTALRSYYKFQLKTEQRLDNPAASLSGLKVPKMRPVPLSEAEMRMLLDKYPFPEGFKGLRDRAIIQTFYETGIRRAELIGLVNADMDFRRGQIRVRGKGGKERLVPILPDLSVLLERYKAKRDEEFGPFMPEMPFFVTDKGKKLYDMFVYRLINRYISIVSNKEKRSPHMIRHSFATHLLDRGADLHTIKQLLGHGSLASTQHYLHSGLAKLKSVYRNAHPRSKKK